MSQPVQLEEKLSVNTQEMMKAEHNLTDDIVHENAACV